METDAAAKESRLLGWMGRHARVRVTRPLGSPWCDGVRCGANYGELFGVSQVGAKPVGAFVMGLHHPARFFDGRVIALVFDGKGRDATCYAVCAPKKKRFIVGQIRRALAFALDMNACRVLCLYERSCGAVVFRRTAQGPRFLLIKNRRSANWGYPKGHVEDFETAEQTARREVLEETGLHIRLLPGFACQSEYVMQGSIEKSVTIFLAETKDEDAVMQEDEIEDMRWAEFNEGLRLLKFENDRATLRKAWAFLKRQESAERKFHIEKKNPGIK